MTYVENKRKELKTSYDYPAKTIMNLIPVTGTHVLRRNRIGLK